MDKAKFRRDILTMKAAKKRNEKKVHRDKECDLKNYMFERDERCKHASVNVYENRKFMK